MNKPMNALGALLLSTAVAFVTVPIAGAECHTASEAQLTADLEQRLKPYMKVREEAKSGMPPLAETTDASKLEGRQEVLAERIRAARRAARQGDILGAPIDDCMRSLIQESLAKNTAKRATKEGNPAHEGPTTEVAVNAPYASDAPLSTMPPTLLTKLPKLPKGLEYRFIGSTLILYDADACLVVDFIPNAGA